MERAYAPNGGRDGAPLKFGERLEKATRIGVSFPVKQRAFKQNEVIELSEKEMLHLCFTSSQGISECVSSLQQFVNEKLSPKSADQP